MPVKITVANSNIYLTSLLCIPRPPQIDAQPIYALHECGAATRWQSNFVIVGSGGEPVATHRGGRHANTRRVAGRTVVVHLPPPEPDLGALGILASLTNQGLVGMSNGPSRASKGSLLCSWILIW